MQDPVANVQAYSPCVRMADLNGDGEWRLLVADSRKKLKVWKGTALQSEHNLLEAPAGICPFYSDLASPRIPALGVAAGPFVFIYRNLRPYYKVHTHWDKPVVEALTLGTGHWTSRRAKAEARCAVIIGFECARIPRIHREHPRCIRVRLCFSPPRWKPKP